MKRILALSLAVCVLLGTAGARGSHYSYRSHRSSSHSSCWACHHRSASARREFMQRTGYPHGRNGYVIDHSVPLACGGADAPSNMQWQTKEETKAKDRWERDGCR